VSDVGGVAFVRNSVLEVNKAIARMLTAFDRRRKFLHAELNYVEFRARHAPRRIHGNAMHLTRFISWRPCTM
jgi:hypothetical protein